MRQDKNGARASEKRLSPWGEAGAPARQRRTSSAGRGNGPALQSSTRRHDCVGAADHPLTPTISPRGEGAGAISGAGASPSPVASRHPCPDPGEEKSGSVGIGNRATAGCDLSAFLLPSGAGAPKGVRETPLPLGRGRRSGASAPDLERRVRGWTSYSICDAPSRLCWTGRPPRHPNPLPKGRGAGVLTCRFATILRYPER